MLSLQSFETIILLFVAAVALHSVALRLRVPYPILLVLGGLALGLTPLRSSIRLPPDLVLLVFLPPVLWATAYFRSLDAFRANARPIALLAVGLVVVTTVVVAIVAHAVIPGMQWAVAILLAAIVAPPDAVAATSMGNGPHIPHRVVTLLEGESLFNDAVALVLYRAALDVIRDGAFRPVHAMLLFVATGTIGVAVGLVVAWLVRWWLRYAGSAVVAVAITLVAPYAAWIAAAMAQGSPVLACVTGGFYLREHLRRVAGPETRVQARAVWDLLVFVLNGLIFILIGLELGSLYDALSANGAERFLLEAVSVSGAVILVRLIAIPAGAALMRVVWWGTRRVGGAAPSWRHLLLLGWAGMRGIVSLAAALALPTMLPSGVPFPFRDEIIFLTFGVILSTLVLQGLSFVPLARRLDLGADLESDRDAAEERLAREHATTAALEWLDGVAEDLAQENASPRASGTQAAVQPARRAHSKYGPAVPGSAIMLELEYLRSVYAARLRRLAHRPVGEEHRGWSVTARTPNAPLREPTPEAAIRLLHQDLVAVQRAAIAQLRDEGRIGDRVAQRLEHELDLAAVRLAVA